MKYYKAFEMFKIDNNANWAAPNWSLTKNFTVNFFKQSFKKLNYFRRISILNDIHTKFETMLQREYDNYRNKPENTKNIQHIDTKGLDSLRQQLLLKAAPLQPTPDSINNVLLALKAAPAFKDTDWIDIDYEIVDDEHLLPEAPQTEVKLLGSAQRKLLKEAPNYDSKYTNPDLKELVDEVTKIKTLEDLMVVYPKIVEHDEKLRHSMHDANDRIMNKSSADPDDPEFMELLHRSVGCEEDLKVIASLYIIAQKFIEIFRDQIPEVKKKKKKGTSSHTHSNGEVGKDLFAASDNEKPNTSVVVAKPGNAADAITAAFNTMGAGVADSFHQAAIDRFLKEGSLTFKNAASIAKIKEDKRYHIREEKDGSVTVLGIFNPKDKKWVGDSGGVAEKFVSRFANTVRDANWTAEDRIAITKRLNMEEVIDLNDRAEYNAKEGLLRQVDIKRLADKWDAIQKKLYNRWNYIYEMDKIKGKTLSLPPAKAASHKIASALDAVLDNKSASFIAPSYAGIKYSDADKIYFLLTLSEGKILMAKKCLFDNNLLFFKIIGELSTEQSNPNVLLITDDYKKQRRMEKDGKTLDLHNQDDNTYPLLLIYKDNMFSTVFEAGVSNLRSVTCSGLVITQMTKPELVKKIFSATKANISGFSTNIKTDVDKDLLERIKKLFI